MPDTEDRIFDKYRLARRMARVAPSAIMEILKQVAGRDLISFASGLPDPDLYPADTLRALTDEILTRDGRAALQYGPAEGVPALREWVADRLRQRGLEVTTEGVLITHGSQQALDLAGRAFLDPGDRVLLESPSYLAAIQTFDSYEAEYETLPVDEDGLNPADLRRALVPDLQRPKLLFILPNFQNPTGVTLAAERRQAVAEMVAQAGLPLLEDDAYHDLRYNGEPLPPVAALARNPWALYTGTFSKTIVPGIRVGYVAGEPALIARLAQLKQITDLHSSSLGQRIALRFCQEGYLDPQIGRLRAAYKARRDAMLAALSTHMTGVATWTHPRGGMFLLLTLPRGVDAASLLPRAMEAGVAFVPGGTFFPRGGGDHTLRLNFVSASPVQIDEGVRLLAGVVREAVELTTERGRHEEREGNLQG
jgi:2-aminoadipate transaminase